MFWYICTCHPSFVKMINSRSTSLISFILGMWIHLSESKNPLVFYGNSPEGVLKMLGRSKSEKRINWLTSKVKLGIHFLWHVDSI